MKVPVISIVDDDESFRKATVNFVRSLGYAASAFSSAEEFLQGEHARDSDCLITDLQMPGMSGLELQSRLAAAGNSLPIIFVSAFAEMKARQQALAAGAVEFLDKPLRDERLTSCLAALLGQR